MSAKYGDQEEEPWVGEIILLNQSGDRCGQWKSTEHATINFKFSAKSGQDHYEERAPMRRVVI